MTHRLTTRDSQSSSPDAILTSLRQLQEQWRKEVEEEPFEWAQMIYLKHIEALDPLLALAESQQQETQEKRP
jgi:hypothetical protein